MAAGSDTATTMDIDTDIGPAPAVEPAGVAKPTAAATAVIIPPEPIPPELAASPAIAAGYFMLGDRKIMLDHEGELDISRMKLKKLPPEMALLTKVTILNIAANELTIVEYWPPNMVDLICCVNKITQLDNLPFGTVFVFASENKLKRLDYLPATVRHLICNDNPELTGLALLPNLHQITAPKHLEGKIEQFFPKSLTDNLNDYPTPIQFM